MPEPTATVPNPFLHMVFMFGPVILIFYVLIIRPQAKARKAHEQMVKNLKKHDEVVTSGGVFGSVVNIKPDAITLRVDENVRIDVEPSAITRLVKTRAKAEVLPAQKPA